MENKNLKVLLKGALGEKVPAEFAVEDYDYKQALLDEMKKIAGSRYDYQRNKWDIFELLAQQLDEELPRKVIENFQMFAEIIQVPDGVRHEFLVRKGMTRARQFVTRATESGVYETFRLDRERFEVFPQAIAGAGYVDFERYLEGLEDMAIIYQIIVDGIVNQIWQMVQELLINSWNQTGRPSKNKVSVNTFDAAKMAQLCNVVRAYGDPIIYCSPEFASEMVNAITYNSTTKISDQDVMDVRDRGFIGRFHGVPVVVMPQSFQDETNTKTSVNPAFAYVIPSGKEKIIKLCMEGPSYFQDYTGQDNTTKMQGYKKVGMAIVNTPNYWGMYYNAALNPSTDDYGWKAFTDAVIAG